MEVLSDLTRHNRAVNIVRFSPDGELLASADDGKGLVHQSYVNHAVKCVCCRYKQEDAIESFVAILLTPLLVKITQNFYCDI